MHNKEKIAGFTLNLHDFSGDVDTVISRLLDTMQRLSSEYRELEFIEENGALQLYGTKISS